MTLLHRPATELIRLVAEGGMSAESLVRAHLDRIDEVNPRLNAIVELRADAALAEARTQDAAAAAGRPRGPLGGLPITIKSAIDVAGLKVETGSSTRRGLVAADDAVVVRRLRSAGAIVLGTTNVADMLMAYESDNPLYGRTTNPWDPTRTAGGSSGGESAAIAAGCSAGGIGSDGGGSVRVPAHFTGITALKPTPGRIPGTGHQPPCFGPFALLGVVGPMARTVGDVAALFASIAGWDEGDPMAAPVPLRPAPGPGTISIGYFEDDGHVPVTAEIRAAVRTAAAAASRGGYAVQPFLPDGLAQARQLWNLFFCEIALEVLHEPLQGAERELPILKAFLQGPTREPLTGPRLTQAWMERDALRATILRQMATHRVLLCPVASVAAFRHGERSWTIDGREVGYLDAMSYTQWVNVMGHPAVTVPVGRSEEGLPIGIQVIGRPWEEELVLQVAAAIERHTGGYEPPRSLSGWPAMSRGPSLP